MAIKKVIEIDVDELKAIGGLQNLGKAIDGVDSSAKDLNATFEEVYGDLQPLTTRMGEAEDRMYELALAGKTTSQEYKDLLKSVANYRKTQIEVDQTVDASATRLDEKLGGALQGVTSSFAAVQGVMALTGGQSEELEKAILKVQGAMALSEGVRGIREGAKSFKALGVSAKTALSGIKSGIAATGIGLLVVALGTIVAYWDDIVKLTGNATDELADQNIVLSEQITQGDKNLSLLNLELQAVQLRGESDENIVASIKKQLLLQKEQQILLIENLQLQLKREKAEAGQISFWEKIKIGAYQAVGGASGYAKAIAESVNPNTEKAIELQTQLDKAKEDGLKVDIQLAQLDKTESDKKKANAQRSVDNAKKLNDEELRLAKEKADALERIRQGEIDTEAERREEELKVVRDQYAKLIEEAVKYNQDTNELKEAQRVKEQELKDKFKKEDDEKEQEYWKNESEKAQKRDEDARLKKEEEANKEIEFQKNKDEAIANSKANFNNIIQGLEDAGIAKTKAGQAVSKAIALTQIGIDSAVAISKASTLANAEGVAAQLAFPLVPGIGTVARVISYASTALSVVSNISKAKKLLSSGGSGGVSTGGGGSAPSVGGGGSAPQTSPTFNVVGNTEVNQIEQSLGRQQPIQAYVVANNVTTAQSLDRNIINNASLG